MGSSSSGRHTGSDPTVSSNVVSRIRAVDRPCASAASLHIARARSHRVRIRTEHSRHGVQSGPGDVDAARLRTSPPRLPSARRGRSVGGNLKHPCSAIGSTIIFAEDDKRRISFESGRFDVGVREPGSMRIGRRMPNLSARIGTGMGRAASAVHVLPLHERTGGALHVQPRGMVDRHRHYIEAKIKHAALESTRRQAWGRPCSPLVRADGARTPRAALPLVTHHHRLQHEREILICTNHNPLGRMTVLMSATKRCCSSRS